MTRCTQPGCTGTIVDGYCDVCGSPPDATPAEVALAGDQAGAGSTVTRGSSRLGSTALGSSRLAGGPSRATRRVGTGSQRLRAARLSQRP